MMNGHDPQPIDGNMLVPITFTLNTWNVVLSMIVKAPWEQANPLVQEIHQQIKAVVEGQAQAQRSGSELRE